MWQAGLAPNLARIALEQLGSNKACTQAAVLAGAGMQMHLVDERMHHVTVMAMTSASGPYPWHHTMLTASKPYLQHHTMLTVSPAPN